LTQAHTNSKFSKAIKHGRTMEGQDVWSRCVQLGVNGGSPTNLKSHGWSRDSLRPGDQILFEGFAARNGQFLVAATTITLTNGTKIVIVPK